MPIVATPAKRKRVSKKPEDRIDDLIKAATAVFGRVGLDNATVADIVDEVGVAKGTFYLYFKSKDDVLALIWNRYLDELLERATESTEENTDWGASMNRLMDRMVRFAFEHADLHQMVYGSANARALEMCRQANERVVQNLADRVRRAVESGLVEPVHVDSAVRMIYHGTHGLVHDQMAQRVELDVDATVLMAQEFARRVLTPVSR